MTGKLLEARAKGRTSEAIKRLLRLQLSKRGSWSSVTDAEVEVPVSEDSRVGDLIVLRPGERVPVDGVVLDGWTVWTKA